MQEARKIATDYITERTFSSLNTTEQLDPLLNLIGNSKFALLGEASHGTHEYYTWRFEITKRLIEEKNFSFIAVEGDWPNLYKVNRYVKNYVNSGESAASVLKQIARWPTWMWANREVAGFVEWLKKYNQSLSDDKKVGFYGLDVYSLWESLYVLINYLQENYSEYVEAANEAFNCFKVYGEDVYSYARFASLMPGSCEDEAIDLLRTIQEHREVFDDFNKEVQFNIEQNALIVKNAEQYYRTMLFGGATSWNIRDFHMMETLNRLMRFHGSNAKGVVWAHNTHIGDARHTSMKDAGEINIGQLARQQHKEDGVVLVGFSTFKGSVIASNGWNGPTKVLTVPGAISDSWDTFFHQLAEGDKLFILKDITSEDIWMGQRAIGVVYFPEFERGNYVPTNLPKRYDALLFIDETTALQPIAGVPTEEEAPETYPSGF